MALGASSGRLQGMILRQGLVIVGIGLALGLLLAFFFGRMLASQLYQISTVDPWTYAVVYGGFFLVSLAACWVPARRTIRVDPIVALRHN